MSNSSFANSWNKCFERLGSIHERFLSDLKNCQRDLVTILDRQQSEFENALSSEDEFQTLDDYKKIRAEKAAQIFLTPTSIWERSRPYKRSLTVIEDYERNVVELFKTLPNEISVNGSEILETIDEKVSSRWRKRLVRLRRKERSIPLQALALATFQRLSNERYNTEGQFCLALSQTVRLLRVPWEIVRSQIDAAASQSPLSSKEVTEQRNEFKQSLTQVWGQADSSLKSMGEWTETFSKHFAEQILSTLLWSGKPRLKNQRSDVVEHWVKLSQSAAAEIRLESVLEKNERQVLSLCEKMLESLRTERKNLIAEVEDALKWLNENKGNANATFPLPVVNVIPAQSRLNDFETSLKDVLVNLPSSTNILSKQSALPRRSTKWNVLRPREKFQNVYERSGRQPLVQVLTEIEAEHQKLVQNIERAREVVSFGLETLDDPDALGAEVVQESFENAHSLLEYSLKETVDWQNSASIRIVRTAAKVFLETRLMLSRARLGVYTYLARQGFSRAAVFVGQSVLDSSLEFLTRLKKTTQRLLNNALIYIGWRQAQTSGRIEVITRPVFPLEFTFDFGEHELPAIYQRLFRFEAVQDPRFLVGREREMEAIAEARSFWEAGRPASLIIVGQRGSGKTSLLNCALQRSLDGLEIIRDEFKERLITEEQLRQFLADSFGAPDPSELENFLAEHRRVIVLEELERIFLRQVGNYAAIRSLQRLIAATCSSTLWILVTNGVAFQFLDAAVKLSDNFSHRINASTATRDDLKQAILLRHNLSGLRLQYLPPNSQSDSWLNRLKKRFRGERDPEEIFFDELAKESSGVYRTAFKIWLGQIESAQAGTLYMKPLEHTDLTPIANDLDIDDLFTLVAILQHGSLTAEEHATIFQKNLFASRSQIDELLSREIIEQDPGRSGFRVRPEAMRLVKETLYRRNML